MMRSAWADRRACRTFTERVGEPCCLPGLATMLPGTVGYPAVVYYRRRWRGHAAGVAIMLLAHAVAAVAPGYPLRAHVVVVHKTALAARQRRPAALIAFAGPGTAWRCRRHSVLAITLAGVRTGHREQRCLRLALLSTCRWGRSI